MEQPERPQPGPGDVIPELDDADGPSASGEVPEADQIEQALPTGEGRVREPRVDRPEADEADWLDQGVVEGDDAEGEPR